MRIASRDRRPARLLAALCLLPLIGAGTADAVVVSAGWTQADVGLNDKGEGFALGVGDSFTWSNPVFDTSYALEYVQKKGSQPTPFFDPVDGFLQDDARVTLHVVQPSVALGVTVPGLSFVPRLYAGGAIGLKVKESWSDFPGVPDQSYGYKETDMIALVGLSVGVGPVLLDVRWSRSMVGQLLADNRALPLSAAAKAAPPADVREPSLGFKTEVLQVGMACSF